MHTGSTSSNHKDFYSAREDAANLRSETAILSGVAHEPFLCDFDANETFARASAISYFLPFSNFTRNNEDS